MAHNPTYPIQKWKKAIKDNTFTIRHKALQRCSDELRLKTKDAVRNFILNGNLVDLEFINTAEVNKPEMQPKPWFDSYKFKISNNDFGYFAFYFDANDQLVIKSLHRDEKSGNTMEFALRNRKSLK